MLVIRKRNSESAGSPIALHGLMLAIVGSFVHAKTMLESWI